MMPADFCQDGLILDFRFPIDEIESIRHVDRDRWKEMWKFETRKWKLENGNSKFETGNSRVNQIRKIDSKLAKFMHDDETDRRALFSVRWWLCA